MIPIHKNSTPNSLTEKKQQLISENNGELPNDAYKNHLDSDIKDTIRESLLEEQGHICAYCMARISYDKENKMHSMKIEHFHCQSTHPNEQLDYKNMLGVCLGVSCNPNLSEGEKTKYEHCDTNRGNVEIKFNPSNESDSNKLKIIYNLKDAEIKSEDSEFEIQLNTILNLNNPVLKNNRLSTLTGFQQGLEQRYKGKDAPVDLELERIQTKLPKKDPYCGILIFYLG